jgi:hypothetical protein
MHFVPILDTKYVSILIRTYVVRDAFVSCYYILNIGKKRPVPRVTMKYLVEVRCLY